MTQVPVEYKSISLKSFSGLDENPGWLKGHASIHAEIDDGGDLILRGAYDDVLEEYLNKGFTAHSHDWTVDGGIIGYPMVARVDDKGLYCESKFHGTADAQLVRQKALERIQDGKEVQLSIGYKIAAVYFLLPADYETELPKLVNKATLQANLEKAKTFLKIRVIQKLATLVEHSIVPWAMNQKALATEVKSGAPIQEPDMTIDNTKTALTKEQIDALPADCFVLKEARLFAFKNDKGELLQPEITAAIGALASTEIKAVDKFKASAILNLVGRKAGLEVAPVNTEKTKDPFFSVKGFFEQVIAENILSAYECISYLYEALSCIEDYSDAGELIGESINTDALIEEAVAEFSSRILIWAKDYLSDDFDPRYYSYYGYMGQSPTLSNTAALNALDVVLRGRAVQFKEHSEAVQLTTEEFAKQAAIQIKLLNGVTERQISIVKFQTKEGREYSSKNKQKLKGHMDSLTKTRDELNAVIDGIKTMVDPEDEECDDDDVEAKAKAAAAKGATPAPVEPPVIEEKADAALIRELMSRHMELEMKLLPSV